MLPYPSTIELKEVLMSNKVHAFVNYKKHFSCCYFNSWPALLKTVNIDTTSKFRPPFVHDNDKVRTPTIYVPTKVQRTSARA